MIIGGAPVNVACALADWGRPQPLSADWERSIGLSFEVLLGSRGVSITGVQHDKLPTRRFGETRYQW